MPTPKRTKLTDDSAAKVVTLAEAFAKCKNENRPAFIPYITAGFATLDSTVPLLLALQEGGADVIELGVPFSDPLADGPVIQKSSFEALMNGVKVETCFEYVEQARTKGLTIPVVLMGYCNPFVNYGEDKLCDRAKQVGIEGFIVVDLPPDDAGLFSLACAKRGQSFIPLVAPTSTDARLASLAKLASGYVYAVSLTGVTGVRADLPADLADFLVRVQTHFKIPVVVGFGLSTPEHVQGVYQRGAQGAVVGSAIIGTIRSASTVEEQAKALIDYVRRMTGKSA